MPYGDTHRSNKTTIARGPFRRDTGSYCAGIAWNSTNVMFGIENQCLDLNRAFSAGVSAPNIPGAMPQASGDIAPLALNRYALGTLSGPKPATARRTAPPGAAHSRCFRRNANPLSAHLL